MSQNPSYLKFSAKFLNSIQTEARRNKSDLNKNESNPRILVSAANTYEIRMHTRFESNFEKFQSKL